MVQINNLKETNASEYRNGYNCITHVTKKAECILNIQ